MIQVIIEFAGGLVSLVVVWWVLSNILREMRR